MKKLLVLFIAYFSLLYGGENMKIKLSFADEVIIVDLIDNVATKSFVEQLPLELTFSDYVNKEKIANLPKKLDSKGFNGYAPEVGDFFYFSPWGNVGIFYEKQPFHSGLILLGKLQNKEDSKKLRAQKQDFIIKIEKL